MKMSSDSSTSDQTYIFPMNIPKEGKSMAWGMLPGSNGFHVSSDATLFSSSLPVFPHEKLKSSHMEDSSTPADDIVTGLNKLHQSVDDSLEDVQNDTIGDLLPGDEDDLLAGIMDDLDLNGLPGSLQDLDDYDLFGSGGGMELENDPQDSISMGLPRMLLSDTPDGNSMPHYGLQNGTGAVAGEHPYGEHPSRTLFVRNINSNVEDSELRVLFEQYGDIRTLYTACKHRGFVMISYYDIRAARTAMRVLQNKPLRRRKLDIHFSIPKDNPSEKDINQGTLVAFNLDPSVSNDDLHQIFGAYGEVKEIRETPHKRHHKFIEFYDVRAAEAALKALNRSDIAGKRIKLEPSRPGGARRNLMLQLNQELEQDELHGYRHQVASPVTNSPPGNWMQLSSPIELSSLQTLSKSPVFRMISPTNNTHLPGLASVLNSQGSNLKLAPIGKDQGKFGHVGHPFQESYSLPEPKLGQCNGTVSSFGSSNSNQGGVETLSGSEFLWGSPNSRSENTSSSVWSSSSIGNAFSSNGNTSHGFLYSAHQGSFAGSSNQHHYHSHHVGSAPSGFPSERHFGFFPESARESSLVNPLAFRGMGIGVNGGSFPTNMANSGIINPGNVSENGFSSFRMMSAPRMSPMFLNNGPYSGLVPSNIEGLRTRRAENNVNQVESKKQFQLDLEKIISGEDTRTTLMIKNIPNKYTSKMLLATIDEKNEGTYDFLYLPIDFKNKCNVGYAFINMLSPEHVIPFYKAFNGKKWEKFNSEKVASLAYARIQGKAALVAHFQNSSLMNEDKRCRPILLHSHNGSDLSDQEHLQSNNLYALVSQPNVSLLGNSPGSLTKDSVVENSEKS